jgi:hypothetical protein
LHYCCKPLAASSPEGIIAAAVQEITPLPAADAADLLQLAVNCSSLATAATVVRRLPQLLEPATARRLPVTALVQRYDLTAERMMKQPAVQAHLDAPTLEVVMRLLLCWMQHSPSVIEQVAGFVEAQVAVAREFEKHVVLEWLQAANSNYGTYVQNTVWHLCRLPAAEQLTPADARQPLTAAVSRGNVGIVGVLCRLPAAQRLGCDDVMQLLQASFDNFSTDLCTIHLCRLPAAQQLSSNAVLQLICRAVQLRSRGSVAALAEVTAASGLTIRDVDQLIQHATDSGAYHCILPLQGLLLSVGTRNAS